MSASISVAELKRLQSIANKYSKLPERSVSWLDEEREVEVVETSPETSPLLPEPSRVSPQQLLQQTLLLMAANVVVVAVAGILLGGALALALELPFLKGWAAGTLVSLGLATLQFVGF